MPTLRLKLSSVLLVLCLQILILVASCRKSETIQPDQSPNTPDRTLMAAVRNNPAQFGFHTISAQDLANSRLSDGIKRDKAAFLSDLTNKFIVYVNESTNTIYAQRRPNLYARTTNATLSATMAPTYEVTSSTCICAGILTPYNSGEFALIEDDCDCVSNEGTFWIDLMNEFLLTNVNGCSYFGQNFIIGNGTFTVGDPLGHEGLANRFRYIIETADIPTNWIRII